MTGTVKIKRNIRELSIYHDPNCLLVFLHLLIACGGDCAEWQGHAVGVGETVTSDYCMSGELGLSVDSVRYALTILECRGYIKRRDFDPWTIVTVLNFEKYTE